MSVEEDTIVIQLPAEYLILNENKLIELKKSLGYMNYERTHGFVLYHIKCTDSRYPNYEWLLKESIGNIKPNYFITPKQLDKYLSLLKLFQLPLYDYIKELIDKGGLNYA